MKPRRYSLIGVLSLATFVNVIAPDLSFARTAIVYFLGLMAVQFIPISLIEYRERALQKRQAKKMIRHEECLKPKLGHYQNSR